MLNFDQHSEQAAQPGATRRYIVLRCDQCGKRTQTFLDRATAWKWAMANGWELSHSGTELLEQWQSRHEDRLLNEYLETPATGRGDLCFDCVVPF